MGLSELREGPTGATIEGTMPTDWDDTTPPDAGRPRPGVPTFRYEVTFRYVESEYARQRGIDEVAYRAEYEVNAASPEEAIAAAERLFRAAERSSGVSWPRTIKSSSCRRLPA